MADGYLEKHYEEYEARKAAWLQMKKRRQPSVTKRKPERPADEAL